MTLDFNEKSLIFCDGACSGNPGPGGWAAIVVLPQGQVRELGGGAPSTTNNRMELLATIEGLNSLSNIEGKVILCTDSVYVIRGITQWIFGWKKKDWKTSEGKEVANKDLWEELWTIVQARGKNNSIDWRFVRGHTGIPGNERCDEIAVSFAKGNFIQLYRGSLLKYQVAIYDIPENTELPEIKDRSEVKAKAHSYLSLLNGIPLRHSSWSECERRVKGQSGAKFKKALSAEDEVSILHSWGVDPKKLEGK